MDGLRQLLTLISVFQPKNLNSMISIFIGHKSLIAQPINSQRNYYLHSKSLT
jgi:hypothetical protein